MSSQSGLSAGSKRGYVALVLLFVTAMMAALTGCGAGGYPGDGIKSLSASSVTLDAGQAFSVSSTVDGTPNESWSLSGPACTGSGCGTLSNTTGASTVYTAPPSISAPIKVTLTAGVAGTSNSHSVAITVNPDPTITHPLPSGTVGTPYSFTLTPMGGTAPVKLSMDPDSLPPGLTFDPSTNVISGTPTLAGTTTFNVQITDASDVPYSATTQESIVISTSVTPLSVAGNPPAGIVGSSYSTTLTAIGGTAPYSWSILSGSLPAGLSLSSTTGVISGTPTTAGVSVFTVQAQDANGVTATAVFSITINNAGESLTLTTSSLPNGVVGIPYSATIGVSGGNAPYSCVFTAGTLPAGLTLNGCVVSGTPMAAGTSNLTVMATDSSSPAQTVSGPESITITGGQTQLTLTTGMLPNGTVGVPYSATIGVSGGTAPYSCVFTAGTLPAGLTLTGCIVSGTPTAAGTSNLTVKATDSSSPAQTASGPESITISAAASALMLTTGMLPNGTVGVPYSATIGISGGTAPYACVFTAGTLPAGLALNGCVVSGTPTVAGTQNLTVRATDSSTPAQTVSGPESITINSAESALTLTASTLPDGTVSVPYSATIGISGGTAPYSCLITGGTLPAGLALGAGCVVSGTPTTAGTTTVTVKATDSSNPAETVTGPETITINPAPFLVISSPPAATVGVPYSGTIPVSGGKGPYTCMITGGALPAGLSLSGCVITGTPLTAGTSNLTVKATDSSSPVITSTGPATLVVNPAGTLTIGNPPPATVGTPYTGTIPVTGGTGPYTCMITAGTLPPGLSINNCTITGTPTGPGSTTITVKGTDSSNPPVTGTGPVVITVNPSTITLTLSSLPNGTVGVPYNQTIGVSGGTGPYSCTILAGTLQAGLSLSGCTVSGTPTASGTANLTVKATDSSNPANTTTGPVSLTINQATLTLTTSTLPNGTVGVPYSATIGVTGGTAPYTCAFTAGMLPAGLTLTGCTVSGTPTTAGMSNLTVKATDSSTPAATTTGPESITINPAPLTLTLSSLPDGTVGVPYNQTIGVAGGTAPYTCTIIAGTLQAGLSLSGCTVSGTPTASGTANLTVKATDSSNPANTTTGPVSLTIHQATLTLTTSTLPNGTVGVPYSATIGVTGGTAPYSCVFTAGTLPAGLTLTGCTVSGTPTAAGTSNLTVQATDSSTPAATTSGPESITINAAPPTLTIGNPPPATVGVPYTGPIPITGGTGPYTCVLTGGTLPQGLTLSSACIITGTPISSGPVTIMVGVTDSGNPPVNGSGPVTITVNPATTLTFTGSLPNGVVGVAYNATLAATGGVPPYTYSITAGALPAGLTLDTNGVVTGVPTTVGASSLTVTATDSESTPQTASLPLVVLITYATGVNNSELDGPYAFLFQGYDDAVLGVLAYQTATIGSFTADGTGVISAGELDANHQGSVVTGNTVTTHPFLGSYQVNADNRGFITITTLNADNSTAQTTTYAIALKAPVAPSKTSTQGSLIEFDNDQLQGTKGSGMLLAQEATSFTAGLNGTYAFGVEGDTPCLPSCTVGVIAGPAAAVGEFTASGGNISAGMSDANVASANFASEAVSGSYRAADLNGRVQLSMTTAQLPAGVYPSDYAVYLVNANQAFVMSTDKHSDFILLAGSAQLQAQTTFGNAAMTGPFIGYENSATSPGLVSATLQNVVNFSTATIFRGTATADGNCNITSVDRGGVTALVTTLTGLGGSLTGLNNILGTFVVTGATTCTVSTTGRGVLQYPQQTLLGVPIGTPPAPRVLYLSAPDRGFFLETGYAGLGNIEPQTGAPYSLATFDGTFIYGEAPASSVASINSSGFITADGKGNETSTVDENIGVGTVNILELGVTSTSTYTTPDPTTGRFFFDVTDVVYTISPGRFVFLDTNPLTTSPSVTLLY